MIERGEFNTYQAARNALPAAAWWSSSFGNPGEERYSEAWRIVGRRFWITKHDTPKGERWGVTSDSGD